MLEKDEISVTCKKRLDEKEKGAIAIKTLEYWIFRFIIFSISLH